MGISQTVNKLELTVSLLGSSKDLVDGEAIPPFTNGSATDDVLVCQQKPQPVKSPTLLLEPLTVKSRDMLRHAALFVP